MSSAIIINLAVIAVIVTGWTAAVAVFYTRLGESRALPRAARSQQASHAPAARPQPALAASPAA